MNIRLSALIVVSLVSLSAHAIVAPSGPAVCDGLGGCATGAPIFSTDNVSIYQGWGSTGEPAVWAGYHLGQASNSTYPDDYWEGGDTWTTVPLTGTLWIEAPPFLTSGEGQVNVYAPDSGGAVEMYSFLFSEEALLGAGGFEYYSGGAGEVDNPSYSGNIQALDYWTCIECGWNMDLNLINFGYVDFGGVLSLQLNPQDDRELIFRNQTTYYYGDVDTYTLSNVPLPAAGWFFLSSLMGIPLIGRLRRARC